MFLIIYLIFLLVLQLGQQDVQLECVDKLRDYLKDPDQHVRGAATDSLAALPENLHYTSYWNKDPQVCSSFIKRQYKKQTHTNYKKESYLFFSGLDHMHQVY